MINVAWRCPLGPMDIVVWLIEGPAGGTWDRVPEPMHGMIVSHWRTTNPMLVSMKVHAYCYEKWSFDAKTMKCTTELDGGAGWSRPRHVRPFAILSGSKDFHLPPVLAWWIHVGPRLVRLDTTIQFLLDFTVERCRQKVRTNLSMFNAPCVLDVVNTCIGFGDPEVSVRLIRVQATAVLADACRGSVGGDHVNAAVNSDSPDWDTSSSD